MTIREDTDLLVKRLFAELGIGDVPSDAQVTELLRHGIVHGARIEWARRTGERHCRVCGCTQTTACIGPEGPCAWAAADLCSVCAHFQEPTT